MLFNKRVIQWNGILFGVLGLLSLVFGLTGLGAMAVLFGAANLFASLIYFLVKQNDKGKTCLLISGCLLLLGFALCSVFPLNIH